MVAKKTYDRQCKQCGKEFIATHHAVRICSDDCRKAKDLARYKAYKKSPEGIAKRKARESDPNWKAKRKEYLKTWSELPGSKERLKSHRKAYENSEKGRKKIRDYQSLPQSRAKQKAYRQTPKEIARKKAWRESSEGKAYRKAYHDSLEAKARRKERESTQEFKDRRNFLKKLSHKNNYIPKPRWEERKDMPHNMYLIRFTQGNLTYLKVGLTHKTPEARFSSDIFNSRMSNFEVLELAVFKDLETCQVAERLIHDITLDSHVKPVIAFHGSSTECRLPSALPQLLSMFDSAKAGKLEVCDG